jgi:hypothetical protein
VTSEAWRARQAGQDPAESFDARLARLDTELFAAIPSQSSDGDKASWLALQRLARSWNGAYSYLEIGSFLGGSIQPHLLDPLCSQVFSIDTRPVAPPDDRGQVFEYLGNSTSAMLANLRKVDASAVAKVVAFEEGASTIDPAAIGHPPALCLIDGEHTVAAVLADFAFCLEVCAERSVIFLHDDWVIYPALMRIQRDLVKHGVRHQARKLGGSTFGFFLGGSWPADSWLAAHSTGGMAFIRRLRARLFLKRVLPGPVTAWVGKSKRALLARMGATHPQ